MCKDLRKQSLKELGLDVESTVPLDQHSSIRVGGPAEHFVKVNRTKDLRQFILWAYASGTPFYMLGGGTNTLFADEGMSGVTVFNRSRHFHVDDKESEVILEADSGLPLAQCARYSMQLQLTGLEWGVSVPGTLGGAVVGNAGAHGSDMLDSLTEVELCQPKEGCIWISAEELQMSYRHSKLKPYSPAKASLDPVILRVRMRLAKGKAPDIHAKASQFLKHRRETQPTEPSVGSVFRNPPGQYAGVLIEDAGCKGLTCGAMAVSAKHVNFIINQSVARGGRARDVITLIQTVRQRVLKHTGILLQPEIGLAGDWPSHIIFN